MCALNETFAAHARLCVGARSLPVRDDRCECRVLLARTCLCMSQLAAALHRARRRARSASRNSASEACARVAERLRCSLGRAQGVYPWHRAHTLATDASAWMQLNLSRKLQRIPSDP